MKTGDKVRVKLQVSHISGSIKKVYWRGAAGSGVSYPHQVEVLYENGMTGVHDPINLEIVDDKSR